MNRAELVSQIRSKGTYLCVGLDTDPSKIPDFLHQENDPVFAFNKAIIDATVKLASSKLNPEQKKVLENEINKAKDLVYKGGLDKQMNEDLLEVDTEQEASVYRYKTYTQKYLTNLAKDLDNETISTEFKNNPGKQAILDQKKFEFDIQKERQRQREWAAGYTLDVERNEREKRKEQREAQEDVKLQPIVSAEKISTDLTKYGMFDLDKDIDVADNNLKQTTNKLAMLMNPNAKTPKELEDAVISAKKLYEQYKYQEEFLRTNKFYLK
jgi:hypothetical protein